MKSYLKFLSRNKLYTFINVSGLIVSMMFIILIGDYTWRQYRIDTWHKNADRIYLMGNEESFHLWPDAANAIQSICPEIEKICHVVQTRGRIVYGERSEEGDYDPYAIRIEESNNHRFASYLVKTNGDKRAKAAFAEVLTDLGCPEEHLEQSLRSLHEDVENSFEDQRNTLKIISLFTIIAIIISVMGFVGMSLFFIRQRQKEIGLRKIMGGTSREVTLLMLRTFCAPLLVSFVIAVPISYYIMNDWLNSFSYRITLSPWIFAATCVFSLLVAVLSVGFQIVKAVRTNPVESIKTE